MKIIKYKKVSNGKYEIILEDNTKIKVYEDIILKENLLWKKEIDDVEELLKKNEDYAIWDIAYKYLNHHVVSINGMREYLKRKGYQESAIDNVINKLIDKKLLNDEYYTKCYINTQMSLSSDGPLKIMKHLESDGISSDVYLNYLDVNSSIWQEKIAKYLEKQARINKKSAYLFRNKMIINLVNLGYEKEMIEHELNKIHIENQDDLKEKEEKKLRTKLSRKYSGEELERKIREKLYQRGFFDN